MTVDASGVNGACTVPVSPLRKRRGHLSRGPERRAPVSLYRREGYELEEERRLRYGVEATVVLTIEDGSGDKLSLTARLTTDDEEAFRKIVEDLEERGVALRAIRERPGREPAALWLGLTKDRPDSGG